MKLYIKENIKLLIYRQTRQPVTTSKMRQKYPRKSNIPHPTSNNQLTDFSTNGALEFG